MKRFAFYLLPILLCFAVGLSASYFQSDSISEWYPLLNKPALTPPNGAFPIAWSIIYICMGLSLGRLIERGANKTLSVLWGIQLFVNFLSCILDHYDHYAGNLLLFREKKSTPGYAAAGIE